MPPRLAPYLVASHDELSVHRSHHAARHTSMYTRTPNSSYRRANIRAAPSVSHGLPQQTETRELMKVMQVAQPPRASLTEPLVLRDCLSRSRCMRARLVCKKLNFRFLSRK